jgi:hypothetical protein
VIPSSGSSKAPGLKRKYPDDVPAAAPKTVIKYRPSITQLAAPSPAPSPARSIADLPNVSPSFFSSPLDPPPSILGSSSSSIPSQSSLTLELTILRSQLAAAQENLRRERERSQQERERFQQELREMEAQFGRERQAYLEFIQSFESQT